MKKTFLKLSLFTLLLTTTAFAGKKFAPLPDTLMKAKSVYIQNESGRADIADKCFQELNEWGRFKIVLNPTEADIVFILTVKSTENDYSAYSTGTYIKVTAEGNGQTTISIVGTSMKDIMWTDTKPWGARHGATKAIVKELRKRIEDQENNSKNKK